MPYNIQYSLKCKLKKKSSDYTMENITFNINCSIRIKKSWSMIMPLYYAGFICTDPLLVSVESLWLNCYELCWKCMSERGALQDT